MTMIARATKRLMGKDVRPPACPVEARDAYRTHLFSMHDQAPPASPRLLRVALDALRLVADGGVNLADVAAGRRVPHYFDVWPGEHYRVLAALVTLLRPATVVEIGTFTGLSALTMKRHLPEGGRLVTFDVRPWASIADTALRPEDFADGRLEQRLDDLSDPKAFERNRDFLESAEFFFIDAPKDGVFEYRLMEHFATLGLSRRPIALFDDTRLWSMLRFWRELPYPKLDITSLSSWSGSGLVELGPRA